MKLWKEIKKNLSKIDKALIKAGNEVGLSMDSYKDSLELNKRRKK